MILRFASLPVSAWRNGLGRKADLASGPGWLLGFAFLDGDADFSDYAGYDRTITLVEGAGFVLESPDGTALLVDRPHAPARFDGGWSCRCRLLAGPCVVLNAISERALGSHAVEVAGAVPAGGTGHAVLLAGTAALADRTALGPRDAVALPAPVRPGPGAVFAIARFEAQGG